MFIPRKVSRPNDVTRRLVATSPEFTQQSTILQGDLKGKGKPTDGPPAASEELAGLVHLALSKHSVWVNPTLISSDDGYVPLARLVRESQGFADMKAIPPEVEVIRAIQAHLPDVLEVRILVSSPPKSVWRTSGLRPETTGGYEIRRKDWQSVRSVTGRLGKRDWDAKTVYLEKLPTRVRSVGAVYRFISALLNSRKACSLDAIQDIRLTPPFDGEVESKHAFKGFAFVTLSSMDHAERLLEDFPWLSGDRSGHVPDRVPPSASADVIDAQKYGVRAITKARWEELRDEYFAYRAQLLNIVHEEGRKLETNIQPKPGIAEPTLRPSMSDGPLAQQDYPRGCLIFARNIHTETNKTTLRKLFSSAVGLCQDVLNYVDFNKGMDSCFLRIRSSGEASTLIEHFHTNSLAQSTGLDADGIVPSVSVKAIVLELVEGKKEELYWEKVPEKVRQQAVQKALEHCGGVDALAENLPPPNKRRRKD